MNVFENRSCLSLAPDRREVWGLGAQVFFRLFRSAVS